MKKLAFIALAVVGLCGFQIEQNFHNVAYVVFTETTVSALPACNATTLGQMRAVSDATAPTYNGTLTGGGTVHVFTYCDGSAWKSK